MADEITLSVNLRITNNGDLFRFQPAQIKEDQSASGWSEQVLSIGTSEEDITFGDITTEGVCVLQNLDATNFVQFGKKDGSGNMQSIGKLLPKPSSSEPAFPAVFYFDSTATLRMKADTAACKVRVMVAEA